MKLFDLFKEKKAKAVIKDMSDKMETSSFQPNTFSTKLIKTTDNIYRVDPAELEQAYISDPIYFSTINKQVQLIMGAGYELIGDKNNNWKNFFDNIGLIGDDMTWNEMLTQIFTSEDIYGKAFVLIVQNKNRTKAVDLLMLDTKKVDYAKNQSDNVLLDGEGKPLGYMIEIPDNVTSTYIVPDATPDNIKTESGSNKIFIKAERIIQYKLYTFGDRLYPLGLIEPSYISVLRKMNIEEAQANSIYQRGSYPLDVSVGDENHHPRPQDVTKAAETFSMIKHDRVIAHPYWEKATVLEAKQSDAVEGVLTYLRRNQIASLSMPESLAIGSGETTNRATLNNQQAFLEYTLIDIVQRTLATTIKYLINPISKLNKWAPVTIKWGDIRAESEMDKADTLINAVRYNALAQETIDSTLRSILNLPTKEEEKKMGVTSSIDTAGDEISKEKEEEKPAEEEKIVPKKKK